MLRDCVVKTRDAFGWNINVVKGSKEPYFAQAGVAFNTRTARGSSENTTLTVALQHDALTM